MRNISLSKAIAGMIIVFVLGFAAGWFAWYAFVPTARASPDPGSAGSPYGTATGSGSTTSNNSGSSSGHSSSSGGW
ncbi:MAG TPA: hypothetical protein ENO31_02900 [Thermoprotei archaeon]|nr:hypothetical protein [TACK group archaeon]HEV51466.1 hypothetical protein [Thermoprotei archaeon]